MLAVVAPVSHSPLTRAVSFTAILLLVTKQEESCVELLPKQRCKLRPRRMLTLTFQLAVVLLTLTLSDAFRAPLKQQTLVTVARSCQQDSSSSSSSGSSSILYKSILKKLTATALSGLVFMNQMPVEPAAASSAASSLVSSSFQGTEAVPAAVRR